MHLLRLRLSGKEKRRPRFFMGVLNALCERKLLAYDTTPKNGRMRITTVQLEDTDTLRRQMRIHQGLQAKLREHGAVEASA